MLARQRISIDKNQRRQDYELLQSSAPELDFTGSIKQAIEIESSAEYSKSWRPNLTTISGIAARWGIFWSTGHFARDYKRLRIVLRNVKKSKCDRLSS